MAKLTGPMCRLCRREGVKLFLKGARCYGEKCAISRRSYAPGQHGRGRVKPSEYRLHLREKQKLKVMYGIMEQQFRRYFGIANRLRGVTGTNLLVILERRLDNLAYRLGFATSRAEARQLVLHGHVLVNGKKVDIPSYLVKPGAVISLKEKSKQLVPVVRAWEFSQTQELPVWLSRDVEKLQGTFVSIPSRDAIPTQVLEQLVVELYSK